jgi:hypothetical protein
MLHEWSTLEDFLHVDDAVRDGPSSSTSSKRGLCVYSQGEHYPESEKNCTNHFLVSFPSFDMFCKVMDACTENYECLVLDNTVKSNKIQDCVFWYKATVRKNFKVGGPELWRLHKKMYNPKYLQQKEDDPKRMNKKTTLKITKAK